MKKLLLTLLITGLTFISFSSAEKITYMNIVGDGNYSVNYTLPSLNDYYYVISGANCSSSNCFSFQCGYSSCKFEGFNSNFLNQGISNIYNSLLYSTGSCRDHCDFKIFGSSSAEVFVIDKTLNFPCHTCDDPYTSLECQTEYSLMPIDSCNSEYCELNNLCNTGNNEFTGNWSALFINEIQHEGAPTINIEIPEEIQRDYNNNNENFNLTVEGYGYDQEKMQSMINTQYYKPTAEEMSGLTEKIADFLPLVAVALLIIRIGRVLKKVFKF